MPTFSKNEVELEDNEGNTISGEVDIEFEIYCGSCGAGICDHGDVCRTYRRGMNRVDVRPCDKCMTKLTNEIESLNEQLASLEQENYELKTQLKSEVT